MTSIDVVGGVYLEECTFPYWKEMYGSAGRAATALFDHVNQVSLHTLLPPLETQRIADLFCSRGVDLKSDPSDVLVRFDYLHSLSDPVITPERSAIPVQHPLSVEGPMVLLFGMMECTPRVKAETCVYDPQSPANPQGFSSTGSQAQRLAIVANRQEIAALTGTQCIREGARHLLRSEDAEVVLVKCGLDGVHIFDRTARTCVVPAYKTSFTFTLGSGDVFAAAFSLAWGIHGMDPAEAADYASRAVAQYLETSSLPIPSLEEAQQTERKPVALAGGARLSCRALSRSWPASIGERGPHTPRRPRDDCVQPRS